MSRELIWFILPINAILWAWGGTFLKAVRRFGYPLLVTASAFYYLGFSWWLIPMLIVACLITRLPLTIKGDSIQGSVFSWAWVFISSILVPAPALFLTLITGHLLETLFAVFVSGLLCGLLITLSNIKETREIFVWKFVEVSIGFLAACPYAYVISIS